MPIQDQALQGSVQEMAAGQGNPEEIQMLSEQAWVVLGKPNPTWR